MYLSNEVCRWDDSEDKKNIVFDNVTKLVLIHVDGLNIIATPY